MKNNFIINLIKNPSTNFIDEVICKKLSFIFMKLTFLSLYIKYGSKISHYSFRSYCQNETFNIIVFILYIKAYYC